MSIQYTSEQLQRKFQGAPRSAGFARIAEVLRTEGRLEEAEALCRQGLEQTPGNITGRLILGKCLVELERLDEAREQFESVLRLDSRCLAALHSLARILVRLKWPDAAAGYYRSILEIEPWDMEALARLRESGAAPSAGPVPVPAGAITGAAFETRAPQPADGGPLGTSGVEEFQLDRVGDFLPGESCPADLAGALQEVNLAGPPDAPVSEPPPPSRSTLPGPAVPEPLPQDVLTSASTPPSLEPEAPAPISGDDVEERLDNLFGASDDAPVVAHDPAEAGALDEATLQIAARRTQERPAPVPDSLEQADFTAAAAGPAEQELSPIDLAAIDVAAPVIPEERVSGEDIEQRLDELFDLSEGTRTSPAVADTAPEPEPESAALAPDVESLSASLATPAPVEELSDLVLAAEAGSTPAPAAGDELVTGKDMAEKLDSMFGGEPAIRDLPPSGGALTGDELPDSGSASWALVAPAEETPVSAEAPAAESGTHAPLDLDQVEDGIRDLGEPQASPDSGILSTESMLPRPLDQDSEPAITGDDIEDRLDSLFSLEAESPRASAGIPAPEPAAVPPDSPLPETLPEVTSEEPLLSDADVVEPADVEEDRTTMMPVMRETPGDWLATQAGAADAAGPEEDERAHAGTAEAPAITGDLGADESRDTMILPVPDGWERSASDEDRSADAVLETAANPLEGAGDTVGIDIVEGSDIADRLDEIFAGQEHTPVVSAPPDAGSPTAGQVLHDEAGDATDTSAIDAGATLWSPLPAPEVPEIPSDELAPDEVTLFAEEPASTLPPLEPALADPVVSGEDISNRLSEIFDMPAAGAETTSQSMVEEELGPGTLSEGDFPAAESVLVEEEMEASGAAAPAASQASGNEEPDAPRPAVPPITRMHDEEESFPEEEENTLQSAAGANVATVTLAEIYFQQGLREQALQIYRQLLEREPGNDSVRKRIQEIEASKPETGGPGQGQDPRRPRPGLKVPKRKK